MPSLVFVNWPDWGFYTFKWWTEGESKALFTPSINIHLEWYDHMVNWDTSPFTTDIWVNLTKNVSRVFPWLLNSHTNNVTKRIVSCYKTKAATNCCHTVTYFRHFSVNLDFICWMDRWIDILKILWIPIIHICSAIYCSYGQLIL